MAYPPDVHDVQVYYEDTDFTGVVYHANYLKYCERAREHLLGVNVLVDLYDETGVGFVVHKATLTYREGAKHGDLLEVRTHLVIHSRYRAVFEQNIFRKGGDKPLVEAVIDLVTVDKETQLVPLPQVVVEGCRAQFGDESVHFKD